MSASAGNQRLFIYQMVSKQFGWWNIEFINFREALKRAMIANPLTKKKLSKRPEELIAIVLIANSYMWSMCILPVRSAPVTQQFRIDSAVSCLATGINIAGAVHVPN